MAFYVEHVNIPVTSETPQALVVELHRLFMQQSMEDTKLNHIREGKYFRYHIANAMLQRQFNTHIFCMLACSKLCSAMASHNTNFDQKAHIWHSGQHWLCTHIQTKTMSAGFAEDMAANKATLHPMFQVLEAKDIWAKGKGHLRCRKQCSVPPTFHQHEQSSKVK